MHAATHLLISWSVAESTPLARRGRLLVTAAGVVPDIDGLGILAELATKDSSRPLLWWSEYHHVLCHNLGFGLLHGVVVAILGYSPVECLSTRADEVLVSTLRTRFGEPRAPRV